MLSESRWTEVTRSEHDHERAGLEFIRRNLPDRDPFRAWANFTFTDRDGKLYEVDLLVITPTGVHLLELKDYAGTVAGDSGTWTITKPNGARYSIDNPRLLADRKAKRLKGLLQAQAAFKKGPVRRDHFYIDAAVFLSTPKVTVELDESGRHAVFGRDPEPNQKKQPPLPGIIAHLAEVDPGRYEPTPHAVVNVVSQALAQAGIRESTTHRRVGSYELGRPVGEGEVWQDFGARHIEQREARHRVRVFRPTEGMSKQDREDLERAARREFTLLHGIEHPAIERPIEYQSHERGPAQVFELDPTAQRLDHWLADHHDDPDFDVLARVDLLREIAEGLRYAHQEGIAHRSLTPEHITVGERRGRRQVRIRDWQTIARTSTSSSTQLGTALGGDLGSFVSERAQRYLAPELRTVAEPNPVTADVFSLGAVAVLVLTGQPPAPDLTARDTLLRDHGHLMLAAVADGVDHELDEVVRLATAADTSTRAVSVDELLEYLDVAVDELTRRDEPDPLDAQKDDQIAEQWTVTRRVGSGSTAVVLRAERDGREEILKIARDDDCAARLRDEHQVLAGLRSERIVATYGLERVAERTVLRLEAADETLARRLERHGPPTLELLERFGTDLIEALAVLEREGLAHRDVKPDNLGVIARGKNEELHLVLFDFSLARTDPGDLRAGTVGYLDPFLSERRTRQWDLDAERYAAAVTLHEMATGTQPRWGDGSVDPALSGDSTPRLARGQLDDHVRESLAQFLARALHRDPAQRFDTAEDMLVAWQRVFAGVEGEATVVAPAADDLDLSGVSADTSLRELGLAPRQLSALDRLGATTCGELATTPRVELNKLPVGPATRRDLGHLANRLEEALAAELVDQTVPGRTSIDRLVDLIIGVKQVPEQQRVVLRVLLGLDAPEPAWASLRHAVEWLEVDHGEVAASLEAARTRWSKRKEIGGIRRELVELLADRHGIAGAGELAAELLRRRGSLADAPLRHQRARAVVRAALETEASLQNPKLRSQRIATSLLVALDGPVTPNDETEPTDYDAETLIDLAAALGQVADELAARRPLAPATEAIRALRQADVPADVPTLPDARLVRVAAAASEHAAVSSRLELYPRNMPAARAVDEARAALLDRRGLTVAELRQRVATRFPEAEPLPDRPELDQLLANADTGLQWQPADDGQPGRYVLQVPGGVLETHASSSASGPTFASPEERDEALRVLDARLRHLADGGGFLALTVDARRLRHAAQTVADRVAGTLVDLDAALVEAMRANAEQAGAKWPKLLEADAAPQHSKPREILRQLVSGAVPDVEARLTGIEGTAVATNLGLLARYDRLDVIERLAQRLAWDRIDTPLRGLVAVVPGTDPHSPPMIDRRPVPVISSNQWAHVPSAWLAEHKETA